MLDFLKNLNPNVEPTSWLSFIFILFITYLIGFLLARWIYKLRYSKELKKCRDEYIKLKNYIGADEESNGEITEDDPNVIKAVKTMDRSGIAPVKKELNFNSFGIAHKEDKDDLKRINGIGKFIEEKLNTIQIYTFEQISKFKNDDIETITHLIEFFPGRIERDNWVEQAKKLIEEKNKAE